jgi:4-hydroxythreonine-4-phosphate dehydrogenase
VNPSDVQAGCGRPRLGNRPRVGVTLGEEGGIGPEVMTAALEEALVRGCDVLLCVGRGLGDWARDLLKVVRGADDKPQQAPARIDVAESTTGPAATGVEVGVATDGGRRRAFEALQLLVRAAQDGQIDAMVTGPVTKSIFDDVRPHPPGQTEYIAWQLGAKRFAMMLAGEPVLASETMLAAKVLRVVPVTTHVPLAAVPALLNSTLIVDCGVAVATDLQRFLGIRAPRIGVCGLNPHAGEGGRLGDEETRVIAPAVAQLRALGINSNGPLSADCVFGDALDGLWDVVLCMYHDQALAPLKTVCRRTAINFTCGLPVPRMSPDHGTAFEIAGRGEADDTSARLAMRRAVLIAKSATVNTVQRRSEGVRRAHEI